MSCGATHTTTTTTTTTTNNSNDCVVLRGVAAGLDLLRVTADHPVTSTTALTQYLCNNERILYGPMSVQINIGEPNYMEGEDDDDESNNNDDDSSSSPKNGQVVVTSQRLLFWTTTTNSSGGADDECQHDLMIPGICIELHAMTDDPTTAVYVQVRLEESSDLPLELTIVPVASSTTAILTQNEENCNALFQALSELISLHPIDPNQDSDDLVGGMMSMMTTMMGGGLGASGSLDDDDDGNGEDDDLVYAAPSPNNGVATEEERQVMLDRLDNLLIVPPELEQQEENGNQHVDGQFDDAEDADDSDDDDIL